MCGIIGISSNKSVSSSIINSLKKLEYRGYDSAGIATLSEGFIKEVKSEVRVENLEYVSKRIWLIYNLSGLQIGKLVDKSYFPIFSFLFSPLPFLLFHVS